MRTKASLRAKRAPGEREFKGHMELAMGRRGGSGSAHKRSGRSKASKAGARGQDPFAPQGSWRSHVRRDGTAKVRYPDELSAHQAAHSSRFLSGIELEVYLCSWCEGWHLASKGSQDDQG